MPLFRHIIWIKDGIRWERCENKNKIKNLEIIEFVNKNPMRDITVMSIEEQLLLWNLNAWLKVKHKLWGQFEVNLLCINLLKILGVSGQFANSKSNGNNLLQILIYLNSNSLGKYGLL